MGAAAAKNQDVIRRFLWVIASVNVHLEELRYFWAKALGISRRALIYKLQRFRNAGYAIDPS